MANAKVENGVRFAQSCVLGRLRRQTFFSLAEGRHRCGRRWWRHWFEPTGDGPSDDGDTAIAGALDRINDHVMRRLGVSRRHLFQTVEHLALAALPGEDFEFAEWKFARVGTDYHVELTY